MKTFFLKLNQKYRRLAVVSLALVSAVVSCFAEGTVTPAAPPDWAASTQTVANSLTTQITEMMPIILGLFAVMIGIGLVKMLIKKFSKG